MMGSNPEDAEKVWSDLAAFMGCTSPDGSAELAQARYFRDLAGLGDALAAAVEAATLWESGARIYLGRARWEQIESAARAWREARTA